MCHGRLKGITMDKRLQKRHRRQVSRAKAAVKRSEPDVRTAEQITAAKEASRPAVRRRNGSLVQRATPSLRKHAGTAAKTDDWTL